MRVCIWIYSLFFIVSFGMMMYLGYEGVSYPQDKHWQYYTNTCSLQCADKACIHPVHYPALYRQLVQPQINLFKQTGFYKLTNLLVYFLLVPLFYTFSGVSFAWSRIKSQSWWLTIAIGITGVFSFIGCVDTLSTSWGRLYLYWGSTMWCVNMANSYHVSLLDVYTAVFGLFVPLTVLLLLLGWLYKVLRFCFIHTL